MPTANTMLIGAQKAGSTSLFQWLGQHPDIFAPYYVKDLPFFTSDQYKNKEATYYRQLFQEWGAEKIGIGCDVNCLFFPETPQLLHQFNPSLQLIVILRHPIDRAFSAYKYAVQRCLEDKSFEQAIHEELEGQRYYSRYQSAQLNYISHGYYYQQIQRYLQYFSRDQLFIGLFEEMREDVKGFMKRLFRFLSVDPSIDLSFKPANPSMGGYRFKFINQFLFQESVRENPWITGIFNLFPLITRYKLRRTLYLQLTKLNKKKATFSPPSAAIKKQLYEVYRSEVGRLSELLDKDLEAYWFRN